MVKVKKCHRCGNTYPLTLDYFHKNKSKKDGFQSYCKTCNIEYYYKYSKNEENRERIVRLSKKHNERMYSSIESLLHKRFSGAKNRAKRKHMDFDIPQEYLYELWDNQDGKCYYSGLSMTFDANDLYTVSIDRIDSSKGYIIGNVALACWVINNMKASLTIEEFVYFCKTVAENQVK